MSSSAAPPPTAEPDVVIVGATELLGWRRRMLAIGGGRAELDWLLELSGGLGWAELQQLHLHPDSSVSLLRSLADIELLWRRHCEAAEPLQYLLGRCPWRDFELAVAPGVLIPRQETELLVDLALELLPGASGASAAGAGLLWADLGTGSGCLAVALARALPAAHGLAVDVSEAALGQAAANLRRCGVPDRPGLGAAGGVSLIRSDWWSMLGPWWGRLDLVVSNPPYIPSGLLGGLDPVVRDHEPRLALDGGPDGLASIRALVAQAPEALAPGGVLLLEHHHDHSPAVLELLVAAGLDQPRPHRDLEGVLRFASARRPLV